jgi:GT2 family glycosyltransferase
VRRSNAPDVLPVSVVVPTIGRAELLRRCLQSISECSPRAAEIVIVDQSRDDAVRSVVAGFAHSNARLLVSTDRDRSLAVNRGMTEAEHDVGLVTDDDCTAAPTWVGVAWRHLSSDPRTIVTGRVLPVGDAVSVPSLIGSAAPRDYTGEIHYDVLFGCNMACSRARFLALGGFDERVKLAEDNDFCYRWLRAGQPLRYDPDLLIWHHAWRAPSELERHFRAYARGQGIFYAKHLRARDPTMVRFLVRDVRRAARGIASRIVRGPSAWPDARLALPRGVAAGLVEGWNAFSPSPTPEASGTTDASSGRR